MLLVRWIGLTAALLLGVAVLAARLAEACPFCAAVSLTFCEEITGADVAVIAKLVAPAATTIQPRSARRVPGGRCLGNRNSRQKIRGHLFWR